MRRLFERLRRMLAGSRPEPKDRLAVLEQRDAATRSQATVAVKRARRELEPDRARLLAEQYRRADDALRSK